MTLLEREPALEALESALGEAARGEGRVALVYGEAGIGKTSLVDHFTRERARAGPARTLWGACDSLHTPRPLGPVYDIAQQAGSGLRERLEAGAPPRAIFSAVLEELRHRPPVIAVLEDLHWADAATLDLVKFLGRRIRQVPALLVLTYRDDELGPRHPLLRAGGARHIPRGARPSTRHNPFGLTAREVEIAVLLARALTNARIGARLHISPKTVDHHVSSILGKLGVTSREEAGRLAVQHGLGPDHARQDGEVLKPK